ncbi:MAG: alkaline phosphatase family protein [Methylococcales bacterium]|nr:alkaline phosphatase family protein [Methylococcales bacterium]
MIKKNTILACAVGLALSATGLSAVATTNTAGFSQPNAHIKHVLLISVDGLHQNDLDWFVTNNPSSTLASLASKGVVYNNAQTTFPSDSFPGMVAQVTGGTPASTGIYYDDSYSHALLPQGTTQANCLKGGLKTGAEVYYAEVIEKTTAAGDFMLDAFQGIPNLYPIASFTPGDLANVPTDIYKLMGAPDDIRNALIDPSTLPVDPVTCNVVYPHQYMQVNTIFEVARSKGMRTAWSDKHAAYEILNGPSGYGIDDLFSPEINGLVDDTVVGGPDWTSDNVSTQRYDTFKVLAVVNEINGYDHSGKNSPGTPAIFGMNFQSVSTAQKLNTSSYMSNGTVMTSGLGGYVTSGNTQVPGPVLQGALAFIDNSLKQFVDAINSNTATKGHTAIIVSAKHGQSPQNRSDLTIINDTTMLTTLNEAWAAQHPTAAQPLVAHAMDDDGVLLWLNDNSTTGTTFAKNFLTSYTSGATINIGGATGSITVPAGIGSDASGNSISKNFTQAGLSKIYAGNDARTLIGVKSTDQRVPDLIGIGQQGALWAGSKLSKVAEHGGGAVQDRHVPIVVWGTSVTGKTVTSAVETRQIAPTILHLLGLDPSALEAVHIEKTKLLPHF